MQPHALTHLAPYKIALHALNLRVPSVRPDSGNSFVRPNFLVLLHVSHAIFRTALHVESKLRQLTQMASVLHPLQFAPRATKISFYLAVRALIVQPIARYVHLEPFVQNAILDLEKSHLDQSFHALKTFASIHRLRAPDLIATDMVHARAAVHVSAMEDGLAHIVT